MKTAIDFKEIDYTSERNSRLAYGLFFVAFMMVGSFFIINLFVGIIISNFNRERERIGKDFLLSTS